jgi:hypothetical protein
MGPTLKDKHIKSSVAPWPGGAGGHALPLLWSSRGKLSMLSEIVKVVDGGGGEDLKCCRPENLVCRKYFSFCPKSTTLAPPQKKNMSSTMPPHYHQKQRVYWEPSQDYEKDNEKSKSNQYRPTHGFAMLMGNFNQQLSPIPSLVVQSKTTCQRK